MKKRWPKLTELQIAALACVRDNVVIPRIEYLSWRTLTIYRAYPRTEACVPPNARRGFNVTCQMKAFRKRKLIQIRERLRQGPVYDLTQVGADELAQHPEF
jgi:hypothetical protein